jgi:hypothetical protein
MMNDCIELKFEKAICFLYNCERLSDPHGMSSADRYILLHHDDIKKKMKDILNEKFDCLITRNNLIRLLNKIDNNTGIEEFVLELIKSIKLYTIKELAI